MALELLMLIVKARKSVPLLSWQNSTTIQPKVEQMYESSGLKKKEVEEEENITITESHISQRNKYNR